MRIHRPRVVGDSLAPYSNDLPSQTHVSTHSHRASPTVPRSWPAFLPDSTGLGENPPFRGSDTSVSVPVWQLRAMLLLGGVGVVV